MTDETLKTDMTKAAVVGWPVKQSMSPHIHAYWRSEHGIEGRYFRIPCPPSRDAFDKVTEIMRARGYVGANITAPHKLHALAAAETASEAAMQIGAANMLSFEDKALEADNSDLYGFAASLEALLSNEDARERALVIGAGGAAPAICLGLQAAGYEMIDITNRTAEKAARLIEHLRLEGKVVPWQERDKNLEAYDIVVNASSLGMSGQPPLVLDISSVRSQTIIADIVYSPEETGLLTQARKMGLRHMNGLGMLLHQAVPGFERWFGVRPAVTPGLVDHIRSVIARRGKGPVRIGLTGSIGMGKTTVGGFFAENGVPVWDADAAVHRLYEKDGAAAQVLAPHFPDAVTGGEVSREKLSAHLQRNPADFALLEGLVHPLVAADRQAFLDEATARGDKAVVLDIPLLFETGQQHEYDEVVVVTAAEEVRRERVMKREGMTEEKFESITSRQMPEMEKMMLADHLVFTDQPLIETAEDVRQLFARILEK